jgi:hypothetical protein
MGTPQEAPKAKFKQFSDFLTGAGLIGEESLIHLRRVLRKEGLISSGGQGYAAKPLEVSDVTNIFLAMVAPDEVKNAPDVIRLYRSASFDAVGSKNCSPWPFGGVADNSDLGSFLDAFFGSELLPARYPDLPWEDFCFEFEVTDGQLGAGASLVFDSGGCSYTATFNAHNPSALAEVQQGNFERIEARRFRIHHTSSAGSDILCLFAGFVGEKIYLFDADEISE